MEDKNGVLKREEAYSRGKIGCLFEKDGPCYSKPQSVKEKDLSGGRHNALLICRDQSGGSLKDGKGSRPSISALRRQAQLEVIVDKGLCYELGQMSLCQEVSPSISYFQKTQGFILLSSVP